LLFRVDFANVRPDDWNPLSTIIRDLQWRATPVQAGFPAGTDPVFHPVRPWEAFAGSLSVPYRSAAPGAAISDGGDLLPATAASHRFVYHRIDDSISCDGRHMTRSVPARILRKLVKDFVLTGRREFEFRIFKRDAEIVTNRKRPNFEVRLRRVQEVVLGRPCGLVIHRRRPGLLELEALTHIEYTEEG
jgi:hypothetical protein